MAYDPTVVHKLQCYHALKLEVACPGLRHSRGSVMKLVKRMYLPACKTGTKAGVLAEFKTLLEQEGVLKNG